MATKKTTKTDREPDPQTVAEIGAAIKETRAALDAFDETLGTLDEAASKHALLSGRLAALKARLPIARDRELSETIDRLDREWKQAQAAVDAARPSVDEARRVVRPQVAAMYGYLAVGSSTIQSEHRPFIVLFVASLAGVVALHPLLSLVFEFVLVSAILGGLLINR